MAKIITLTPEFLTKVKQEFEEELARAKISDGKITFSRAFDSFKRPCKVWFTPSAWIKMQALIRVCDKEIGWHGVAVRGEDPEKDEYIIKDILVYPQQVSAATVTTDQKEYQTWLMELEDDVFNNLRMQGHSHVNMSTGPSSVDLTLYEKILQQMEDDMFYIFLIYNKRGECTYKVYDMSKNVMFETSDVAVGILDEELDLAGFVADAMDKVKTAAPVTVPAKSGSYNYGGYGGAYSTPASPKPVTPVKSSQSSDKYKPSPTQYKGGKSFYDDDDDLYGYGEYGYKYYR